MNTVDVGTHSINNTHPPESVSSPMQIITLMDYPDDDKYNLMEMIWLRRVLLHAPESRIRILTLHGLSNPVENFARQFPQVSIEPAQSHPFGKYDHFNLAVKLFSLSQISEPFLFLDADMFVISDLHTLWNYRLEKPWIGVDDQTSQLRLCAPFSHLNSGMQLVSDPYFYDYDRIYDCFESNGSRFLCNGEDQAVLFDYFRTIGYDYHHPSVNAGWNCCSRYARLFKDESGDWKGKTRDFPEQYPVHIVHYWNGSCRPWHIGCPLFVEEAGKLISGGFLKPRPSIMMPQQDPAPRDSTPTVQVCCLNAPFDTLTRQGEHPFAPLAEAHIENADQDEADLLFWHMRPDHLQEDYRQLVYQHHQLLRDNEYRFMLYTTARKPSVLYLNNALSLTPFPVYAPDINRLSNVFPVPWLHDGGTWPCLEDDAFINECRNQTKQYDLAWVGPVTPKQAASLQNMGLGSLLHLNEPIAKLQALESTARDNAQRTLLLKLASARFYYYITTPSAPFLLYHALLIGVPPVLPSSAEIPYYTPKQISQMALTRKGGTQLGAQIVSVGDSYAERHQAALTYADSFCRPAILNDRIITNYIIPYLSAQKKNDTG